MTATRYIWEGEEYVAADDYEACEKERDEMDKLNAILSAGQCCVSPFITGDDYGNPVCPLKDRVERIMESAPDCGDNSCFFAAHKIGQRTNGGCRCTIHQAREWATRIRAL